MGRIIAGGFFAICGALAITMIIQPRRFIEFNLWYFRWTFRLIGYDIELRPVSPGAPERFARRWGMIMLLLYMVMFGLVFIAMP